MKLSIYFSLLLSCTVLTGNLYAGAASKSLAKLADSLIAGYSSKTGASKTILAVFPLNCEGKLKKQGGGFAASEIMSHRFIANEGFTVVERGEMAKLLSEQALHASGIVDGDTTARLGKVLGAGVALVGNIQKVGRKYQLNARLVNVETSEIIVSGYEELEESTFNEDAGEYLRLVPEEQTLGIYAIYSYRNNRNNNAPVTEDARLGGTFTRRSHSFTSNLAGGGLLYRPVKNLQLNAEVTKTIKEPKYASYPLTADDSILKMETVSLLASYVSRITERWGYWIGLGLQKIAVDASYQDNKKDNPDIGLFAKTGIEFKPQSRIGLGVNLRHDLQKVSVYSTYNNKILRFNPLSIESTLTLYF